jgi:hypothetical protein
MAVVEEMGFAKNIGFDKITGIMADSKNEDPEAKTPTREAYLRVRFINEADESGIIDKLYRRQAK